MVTTVISTVPLPAGAVAVICVALFTVKPLAVLAPNFTAVAPVKFVPVITTEVPPVAGPADVPRLLTVGAPTYEYLSLALVALVPAPVTTVISTTPATWAGAVAVICVALLTVKPLALVAPNFTLVAFVKLLPVMMTDVPAVKGPEVGETLVMLGAGVPPVIVIFTVDAT